MRRGRPATGWPSQRISPASARRIPRQIRIVVVLPAPLAPRKPKISPRGTLKDSASSASVAANRFVTRSISRVTGRRIAPVTARRRWADGPGPVRGRPVGSGGVRRSRAGRSRSSRPRRRAPAPARRAPRSPSPTRRAAWPGTPRRAPARTGWPPGSTTVATAAARRKPFIARRCTGIRRLRFAYARTAWAQTSVVYASHGACVGRPVVVQHDQQRGERP